MFVILKIRKLEVDVYLTIIKSIPNIELFNGDKKFCGLEIIDKFHQEKDSMMKAKSKVN